MNVAKHAEKLSARYRVDDPARFRLRDCEPADTAGLDAKEAAAKSLDEGVEHLAKLQERLYAQDRWSLLLIFQAMDAAGKDSTIKHVMSGVNPQGCQVWSFKRPSDEELDHDYLWRGVKALPERGRIGIHNRSWYEEVLVVRVHPKILEGQKLPDELRTKSVFEERYEDIAALERHLARNGTVVLKFFLNVSREEQKKRFLERYEDKTKVWKVSPFDVDERERWDDYMKAYEDAIRATSTKRSPWYVVPADKKWFTRLVVVAAVIDALEGLNPRFPAADPALLAAIDASHKKLLDEGKPREAADKPAKGSTA